MARCPKCDLGIEADQLDPMDADVGNLLTCSMCGSCFQVVNITALELVSELDDDVDEPDDGVLDGRLWTILTSHE